MTSANIQRTVLVDSDGVLADFDSRVLTTMQNDYPHIHRQPRTHHIIADDYPSHKQMVDSISRKAGFFATLPIVEGAVEGWGAIVELGYAPRVCTGLLTGNPTVVEDKKSWLEEHFVPEFGYGVIDGLIITNEKHLKEGIALIDDNPEVKTHGVAPWQQLVFDRTYNKDSPLPRLNGWSDHALGRLLCDSQALYVPVNTPSS